MTRRNSPTPVAWREPRASPPARRSRLRVCRSRRLDATWARCMRFPRLSIGRRPSSASDIGGTRTDGVGCLPRGWTEGLFPRSQPRPPKSRWRAWRSARLARKRTPPTRPRVDGSLRVVANPGASVRPGLWARMTPMRPRDDSKPSRFVSCDPWPLGDPRATKREDRILGAFSAILGRC